MGRTSFSWKVRIPEATCPKQNVYLKVTTVTITIHKHFDVFQLLKWYQGNLELEQNTLLSFFTRMAAVKPMSLANLFIECTFALKLWSMVSSAPLTLSNFLWQSWKKFTTYSLSENWSDFQYLSVFYMTLFCTTTWVYGPAIMGKAWIMPQPREWKISFHLL